jgi:hypothetical protein
MNDVHQYMNIHHFEELMRIFQEEKREDSSGFDIDKVCRECDDSGWHRLAKSMMNDDPVPRSVWQSVSRNIELRSADDALYEN